MNFTIRPARRSSAKPLIGMYSESGKGKTYSALLLARGFVGPKGRICMIETESGRGEAYVDMIDGGYDVISIKDDFSPANYNGAINAAEKANVDAIIIDSASHEWEGVGGVLDMATTNIKNGKKSMLAWQQPKIDHAKLFMLKLLQTPIPLVIVCMRAKYVMEEGYKNGKKTWTRSQNLSPKQSEDILFELFVHGWIDGDHCWNGTKYTHPSLSDVFEEKKQITIETGRNLARWASGDQQSTTVDSTEVLSRISVAKTEDELKNIGSEIAGMGLSAADVGDVRKAYKSRLDTIKEAVSGENFDYGPPPMTSDD